jgi:NAD(P)-dependent dehydrogenase (short-subunit alcohol dehydrogenase family)
LFVKLEAFLPALRKTAGRIVITSSGAAVHSYSGWGPYCASKAALRSIGETLGLEERTITTVSVRPGVVDTEMQRELREQHLSVLDEVDQMKFGSLKKDGKLLRPEQPGNVIARLSVEASKDLSGKLLR